MINKNPLLKKISNLARKKFIIFSSFIFLILAASFFFLRTDCFTTASDFFAIGNEVKTIPDFADIRSQPSEKSSIIGRLPKGTGGRISAGPVSSGGCEWWKVDFDKGVSGWILAKFLGLAAKSLGGSTSQNKLKWGAFAGDQEGDMENFEKLVGKKTDFFVKFISWEDDFPFEMENEAGKKGKTLVLFWEPGFGYDKINNGSNDKYIKNFAAAAEIYNYPVILIPFPEMNLNEQAWGYGINNNSPEKFKAAWKRMHGFFSGVSNVKFGIAFNNFSVPDVKGNAYDDYYPGQEYVDYVGVDGFNFGNPWYSFGMLFDRAVNRLQAYNKPIYIFSTACTEGEKKAEWISDGLGGRIKFYKNLAGWIWFNQGNKNEPDWRVNSNPKSLEAFKKVIP